MKKNHVFKMIAILLAITSLQSCAIFMGIDKEVNFKSHLDKVSVNFGTEYFYMRYVRVNAGMGKI
jgi:hypothetical protein